MRLKSRLRALRQQTGRKFDTQTADERPEIRERLERIRRDGAVRGPRGLDEAEVAERLGGECLAPGLIRIERWVGLDTKHGAHRLDGLVGRLIHPDDGNTLSADSLLFFDTETTGLAGGTGTLAFLLGMARLEGTRLRVRQLLLTSFAGEAALLDAAKGWFSTADGLVSFNGKSFDLPLLLTRHRLKGRQHDWTEAHIDLLHPVRRTFGRTWPDCRLQTVEQRLLGFHRSDDLCGSEAPQVWFEWVRFGQAGRLPAVLRHNHLDLVSLAALLPRFVSVFDDKVGDADIFSVASAWLKRGNEQGAYHLLKSQAKRLTDKGLLLLAWFHRRREEWAAARGIWRELAARDNEEAIEQLAKYYEHVARDLEQALTFAERLPGIEHESRRLRLRQKLLAASNR